MSALGFFKNNPDHKQNLGREGEAKARSFLEGKGWDILDQNWRPAGAKSVYEIDLVAKDRENLVFVEVKTRTDGKKIPVYTALSHKKKESLLKAAQIYLSQKECWDASCRFDLICIWLENNQIKIEHYDNVIKSGNSLYSSNTSWQPW